MLPSSFGCWKTVYGYFNRWRQQGDWKQILAALTGQNRTAQGRWPTPSVGIVDAQSIRLQPKVKQLDMIREKGGQGTQTASVGRYRRAPYRMRGDGRLDLGCRRLEGAVEHVLFGWRTRLKKLWADGGYRGQVLKKWVANLKKDA